MIIVSDTSPLNYLVLLGITILPEMFGKVIVPPAVMMELTRPERQQLFEHGPAIRRSGYASKYPQQFCPDSISMWNKTEAISIAAVHKADALLIDDRKGRLEAVRQGITIISTLTVLETAAQRASNLPA